MEWLIFAFDEKESMPNLVLGVLCHTARKIEIFSVMGRRRRQFSPPPPPTQTRTQSLFMSLGERERRFDSIEALSQ